MHVEVTTDKAVPASKAASCLVLFGFEDTPFPASDLLDDAARATLDALASRKVLTGKALSSQYLPATTASTPDVLVLGLGKQDALDLETVRRAAGKACKTLTTHRVQRVLLDLSTPTQVSAAAFLEGLVLGQYDFDVYKTPNKQTPAPVKVESLVAVLPEDTDTTTVEEELRVAALSCLAANGARHLANTPGNEMTPSALAAFAEGIANEDDCTCTVLETKQMETLGMNALLGVAGGSVQSPCLIALHYTHPDATKTLAMVGKGITFDSGGISIKPSAGMEEMKFDMCGAAAVLCAMMNIVELKPAVNVVCVVPAAENMPGNNAQRPGDIVRAFNGKTIEVNNTDAEGRLILADALAYAVDKYHPDAMVDLATLTGACCVALGHYAAGLMSPDDALAQSLEQAGQRTGERVWRLPLWDDYCKLMEGTHADITNTGPREAGTITAGAFLKNFVAETPWAHLDIAGTAWGGKNIPYWSTDHATGYGVRLLTRWVLDQASATKTK